MLAGPSCSSTNSNKSNEPSYGVMSSCTQDLAQVYLLNGIVAEYFDNYEDRAQFHVRFFDTRPFSHFIRLINEEEILNFINGDKYNIVEIMQKGQRSPSAVIYRNFENKPTHIRYYTYTDASQEKSCDEIFYDTWDTAYIRIAGNQILENLRRH